MDEKLQDAITKAESQLKIIIESMEARTIDGEVEYRIIASYVLISTNHFESIIELIKIDKYISASALIRPNFEALIRGTWLTLKANDDKVKKVINKLSTNQDDFPPQAHNSK